MKMLGIITVNYNQYQLTREFLDSLAAVNNAKDLTVYIADVSTKNEIFNIDDYPMTVIIKTLANKGYSYGINEGAKYFINSGLDKFCAINNDVLFDKNFATESEKGFKNADIFGGKIYYAPGYEYYKDYQKKDIGKVLWYAGGIYDWKNAYTSHRGVDEVDNCQFEKLEETDFITGCLLFFNKKVIDKIGFWEEKYFLYYEDSDFCERAKKSGFKLFYNPKIIIWHKNAQSTGGSGSRLHQEYQRKNRLIFGLKYAPFRTKLHLIKNYILEKK